MWIATFAFLCLWAGFFQRRRRTRHIVLVLTGMGVDAALVIYLEISRGAVETALSFELAALQQVHIALSTIALLLYVPTIWLGIILAKNRADTKQRRLHKTQAIAALTTRTLGFLFMFSMLGGTRNLSAL